MEVTKVRLTRDYVLPGGVYFKDSIVYVSAIYRRENSTVDIANLYDSDGAYVGDIKGHWFDFADKTLFVKVETEDN